MSKIIRNYKYRLYPTAKQEQSLDLLMTYAWRTYNDALHTRIMHYRESGVSLSHYDLRDIMAADRKRYPESFGLLMSSTIDALCKRVIDSYTGAFSRLRNGKDAGFPSEVKRRNFRNLPFVYGVGVRLFADGKYKSSLRVTNVGFIDLRYHRDIPSFAKIKRVMVVKEKTGQWSAVFTVDMQEPECRVAPFKRKRGKIYAKENLSEKEPFHDKET